MSDSLRNQLLGLGFKPSPAKPADRRHKGGGKPRHDAGGKPRHDAGGKSRHDAVPKPRHDAGGKSSKAGPKPRSREEIDLAKAYAIRAQREKEERIAAEQARQEEARRRREARARLAELLQGKTLNRDDAEIARHFEYGGKIKRIYVTADQLKALNAGELGVVQQDGRYLLVTAAVLEQAGQVFAPAIALKVDPAAQAADDPYADPKYQVPDDLVW